MRTPDRASRTFPARLGAVLLAGLLAGCSLPDFMSHKPQTRGNKVDDDQLAQLIPGTSTRRDATALLGTPTTQATFDENTWLYISQVTRAEIGATNLVEEQRVVALTFDAGGILRGITKRGADDSIAVAVADGATKSPGTETSFMQQLLGNIGRFNPGTQQNGPTAGRGVSGNY